MEYFTLHDKIIAETDTLMYLVDGILRIARNDTVNKSAVYSASLFKPRLEAFSEVPEVDILIDAFLEFLTVKEDQLTWEDDESLALVTIEMVVSVIKELGELARI